MMTQNAEEDDDVALHQIALQEVQNSIERYEMYCDLLRDGLTVRQRQCFDDIRSGMSKTEAVKKHGYISWASYRQSKRVQQVLNSWSYLDRLRAGISREELCMRQDRIYHAAMIKGDFASANASNKLHAQLTGHLQQGSASTPSVVINLEGLAPHLKNDDHLIIEHS